MRNFFNLTAAALLLTVMLCSCSSDSDGASKPIAVVVFILLFIAASICSAVITYKLKTKKYSENNDGQDAAKNTED